MKTIIASSLLTLGLLAGNATYADDYTIDTEGMHASIQFRIQHLGYSWLYGRFDKFSGNFSYEEAKPEDTKVEVTIDTTSVNSNHAERDKHLSGEDFLDVKKFPEAKFVSTKYSGGKLEGNLTLHGITKPISIDVKEIGAGGSQTNGGS